MWRKRIYIRMKEIGLCTVKSLNYAPEIFTLLYQNIPKDATVYPSYLFIYLFTYLFTYIYLSSIILSMPEYQKVKLKCSLLLWIPFFRWDQRHQKINLEESMVWAESVYINIVLRIPWYNLIIHLPVGLVFHLQVRVVTAVESSVQIEMMLTLPLLFIHCKEKIYKGAIWEKFCGKKNIVNA